MSPLSKINAIPQKLQPEFDGAFIGYSIMTVTNERLAVYDFHKVVAILKGIGRVDTHEEAMEWIRGNIAEKYFGKPTPILVRVDE